ncbi:MAG: hypothetical protein ACRD2L_24420 [Terriglobia bacterium]
MQWPSGERQAVMKPALNTTIQVAEGR